MPLEWHFDPEEFEYASSSFAIACLTHTKTNQRAPGAALLSFYCLFVFLMCSFFSCASNSKMSYTYRQHLYPKAVWSMWRVMLRVLFFSLRFLLELQTYAPLHRFLKIFNQYKVCFFYQILESLLMDHFSPHYFRLHESRDTDLFSMLNVSKLIWRENISDVCFCFHPSLIELRRAGSVCVMKLTLVIYFHTLWPTAWPQTAPSSH